MTLLDFALQFAFLVLVGFFFVATPIAIFLDIRRQNQNHAADERAADFARWEQEDNAQRDW